MIWPKSGNHATPTLIKNSCSIHFYVVPTVAEYVQHRVCFVNVQSSLHENVVFTVCAHMGNAAYIIFIMWNSISGLDTWYHFRFNISCGVAVKVRSHQEKFQVIFSWGGEGDKIKIWRDRPIFKGAFVFRSSSFLMSFSFLRLS